MTDAATMNMDNDAKVAVVTGASSGIGRAITRSLAANDWRVVALARREERLKVLADEINADGFGKDADEADTADVAAEPRCAYALCDVTDEASTQAAVDKVLAFADGCGGAVKALINCAGGAIGQDSVETSSLADWRDMYELNVIGTLRVTQKLLPALKSAPGGGSVVFISSTAGIEPYEGGSGYCAAKSAERVLARVLRLEQVGQPLRVIDVSPGMVKTEEFSLNRFDGNQAKADAVYAGVPDPLTAEDIAESVRWALSQPDTVDIDSIVVRPRAQGSYTKLDRR